MPSSEAATSLVFEGHCDFSVLFSGSAVALFLWLSNYSEERFIWSTCACVLWLSCVKQLSFHWGFLYNTIFFILQEVAGPSDRGDFWA